MTDEQTPTPDTDPVPPVDEVTAPTAAEGEPELFPATYVTELRAEAAKHRSKYKSLAAQLVHAWAAADGRMVDPTDLPVVDVEADEDGNYSREAVTAAIDRLLKSKPHLAAQRPAPLPQGARPDKEGVSLLGLLNARP